MSENTIRVLTFNCWGLKYVSKVRTERIEALCRVLTNCNYDIITLQEIWVIADYHKVRECVSKRLPNAKFFYSGALGSGLAIFSRYPIVSTLVYPYSLNGSPIDVSAGDWFVGKAASSVVILHPVLGEVQVFNTHLFAKGGESGPEYNRAHRLVNAWEFSKLARNAAELGRYVIAAGDFNSVPTTLPITLIREHTGLLDSWLVSHPVNAPSRSLASNPASPNAPATTPLEAIEIFGVTADSPLNSWSAGKPLDPHARQFWGKRLDYIFYRQPAKRPSAPPSSSPGPLLHCTHSKVVLTELVPGGNFSISDHFGLESTFEIVSSTQIDDNIPSELANASISTTIQALTACYRFSRSRAQNELLIFGLSILLLLALAVGSAWVPSTITAWANPVFIIVGIALAWLATTMLYEGFLYGNWEQNALMNVIEELEIHRTGRELHLQPPHEPHQQ